MTTYNPNDFYPRTGQEIKSDGTTVNEADGLNSDGSQNVVLTGSKVAEGIANMVLNTQGTLLSSSARTSNTAAPTQTNTSARGVMLFLNVTAVSGTGGLTVRIYGVDPVSGVAAPINAPPATVTTVGLQIVSLYPGIASPNAAGANYILPRTWYAQVVHGDSTSYTYSLGYSLIL